MLSVTEQKQQQQHHSMIKENEIDIGEQKSVYKGCLGMHNHDL